MGREIIFEVRKNNKVFWPENGGESLCVCGRDSATTYLAQVIIDASKDEDEEPVLFLTSNDYDKYFEIKSNLQEYYNKDMKEIKKAKDALEDLREARRHTTTIKDFEDFSNVMDETESWIEDNDYSSAGSLLEYLDICYNMLDNVNPGDDEDIKVAIILSE